MKALCSAKYICSASDEKVIIHCVFKECNINLNVMKICPFLRCLRTSLTTLVKDKIIKTKWCVQLSRTDMIKFNNYGFVGNYHVSLQNPSVIDSRAVRTDSQNTRLSSSSLARKIFVSPGLLQKISPFFQFLIPRV